MAKFEVQADLYNHDSSHLPVSTSSRVKATKVYDDFLGVFTIEAGNYESAVIALLTAVDHADQSGIFWLRQYPLRANKQVAYVINQRSGIPERLEEDW